MSELLSPRTPGAALKAAREKRGLSVADVVQATRIKPHVVEALENNDYTTIAAPLYGKGFITLYAKYLGLDPAPLVQHYLNYYARTVRPTLKTEIPPPSTVQDGIPQPSPLSRFSESGNSMLANLGNSMVTAGRDALKGAVEMASRVKASGEGMSRQVAAVRDRAAREDAETMPAGRLAALGFAIAVVVMLVASLVYWVAGKKEPVSPKLAEQHVQAAPARSGPLKLAVPPPAPYIRLK